MIRELNLISMSPLTVMVVLLLFGDVRDLNSDIPEETVEDSAETCTFTACNE